MECAIVHAKPVQRLMCEDEGDHLFSEIFFAPHPYCRKMGDTRLKGLLMNEGELTYEEDFFRCGESQIIGTGDEEEDENGLGGNGGNNMGLEDGEDESEFFSTNDGNIGSGQDGGNGDR